jgi:hypothetical protein
MDKPYFGNKLENMIGIFVSEKLTLNDKIIRIYHHGYNLMIFEFKQCVEMMRSDFSKSLKTTNTL